MASGRNPCGFSPEASVLPGCRLRRARYFLRRSTSPRAATAAPEAVRIPSVDAGSPVAGRLPPAPSVFPPSVADDPCSSLAIDSARVTPHLPHVNVFAPSVLTVGSAVTTPSPHAWPKAGRLSVRSAAQTVHECLLAPASTQVASETVSHGPNSCSSPSIAWKLRPRFPLGIHLEPVVDVLLGCRPLVTDDHAGVERIVVDAGGGLKGVADLHDRLWQIDALQVRAPVERAVGNPLDPSSMMTVSAPIPWNVALCPSSNFEPPGITSVPPS